MLETMIFYEIILWLLIVVKFSFEYNLSSCSSYINRINLRQLWSMSDHNRYYFTFLSFYLIFNFIPRFIESIDLISKPFLSSNHYYHYLLLFFKLERSMIIDENIILFIQNPHLYSTFLFQFSFIFLLRSSNLAKLVVHSFTHLSYESIEH